MCSCGHRCVPVRFHHFACKFEVRMAAETEVGKSGEGGGGWARGGGHVLEKGRVREGVGRGGGGERWCDDGAAGAVFVHASAGKLITRCSPTPLKC